MLRCDKVILAGLEATITPLSTTRKTHRNVANFAFAYPISGCIKKKKAEQLKACLANRLKDYQFEIEESFAQIGSGSQPMATIPYDCGNDSCKNRGKIDRTFKRYSKC